MTPVLVTTVLTSLVIALVLQAFCRPTIALARLPRRLTVSALFRRFTNAALISLTYQITWLFGSRLALWLWRAAFFHGPAALVLLLVSASVFFLWPGLSLKLAAHLFPRRLGRYSWSSALELGLVMALMHIVFVCVRTAFWLFYTA